MVGVPTQVSGDSTIYTLTYGDAGKPIELAFWSARRSGAGIRLKNQPHQMWRMAAGTAKPKA